jgi:hypothetical protein
MFMKKSKRQIFRYEWSIVLGMEEIFALLVVRFEDREIVSHGCG